MACASGAATLAVGFTIRDSGEEVRDAPQSTGLINLRIVVLFALFFFFQVGMETMFGAWISTFVLRITRTSFTLAAVATAVYWTGFMASRGLSALLLLRLSSGRLLRITLPLALCASTLLVTSHSPAVLTAAILLVGAALAPTFPVALATFFDRARHSSDTRFVLAFSGFGGSVFPWLVGSISSHSGSLRAGLWAGPATLLVMTSMLPFVAAQRAPAMALRGAGEDLPLASGQDE
jgi:MFS transporter, FHS family, glucose/mannose:H+ symporter